jgi:hypothetical protein
MSRKKSVKVSGYTRDSYTVGGHKVKAHTRTKPRK